MFTEQPCVKKPMKYDNPFTRVILQITVYVLGMKNHQKKFYVKKGQCSFHVFPLLSNTYYDIELIDFGPQIEQTLSSFKITKEKHVVTYQIRCLSTIYSLMLNAKESRCDQNRYSMLYGIDLIYSKIWETLGHNLVMARDQWFRWAKPYPLWAIPIGLR